MRLAALVTALLGGLLVAACSTRTPGSAVPAGIVTSPPGGQSSQSTQPGQSAAGDYGAPKVATPLDTTKWQPDPCTTLTPEQQHAIGITVRGSVQVSVLGNICQWDIAYNAVYDLGFNVKFGDAEPPGLANAYYSAGPGAMRQLPDVHGQPAATEPSQNADGNCAIYLGATDQIEYAVSVRIGHDQPHYQNACSVAQQIADDATATMKSGS